MSRSATAMSEAQRGRNLPVRDPFRELVDFQRGFNNLFGDVFGGASREAAAVGTWSPAVDIYEDENGYTIKLELPEVDKNDVKVNLDKNVLSISGERHLENVEKRENYHRVERSYGQFFRSFTLPPHANLESIGAEFKNGVLRLHIPKKEEAKPKQIQVEIK
jgi:HSP20 family protein